MPSCNVLQLLCCDYIISEHIDRKCHSGGPAKNIFQLFLNLFFRAKNEARQDSPYPVGLCLTIYCTFLLADVLYALTTEILCWM